MESEKCLELTKKLEEFYFECTKESVKPKSAYLQILHDKAFAFATHRLIISRNKHRHAPTYLLRFDFDSTYSLPKKLFVGDKFPGVCHADDTSYYFQMVTHSNLAKETDEWKTIDRMCEIFSTFARVGNPNNELIAPIDWKPVTFDSIDRKDFNYKCLNVSNEVSYIDWPEFELVLFWDEAYKQLSCNGTYCLL